jgi:hypothetical protein
MSVTGKIKNGMVVLPPGTKLPADDPFVAAVLKVAKPRPHWPKDFVLNHGHYVSGEPKKS